MAKTLNYKPHAKTLCSNVNFHPISTFRSLSQAQGLVLGWESLHTMFFHLHPLRVQKIEFFVKQVEVECPPPYDCSLHSSCINFLAKPSFVGPKYFEAISQKQPIR